MRLVVAILIVVALAALLEVARRRHRLGAALVAIAIATAVLWIAALIAIRTDYRDADGTVDCWPTCTPLQDGVGIAFYLAPIVLATLAIIAGLLSLVGRMRERQAGSPR